MGACPPHLCSQNQPGGLAGGGGKGRIQRTLGPFLVESQPARRPKPCEGGGTVLRKDSEVADSLLDLLLAEGADHVKDWLKSGK